MGLETAPPKNSEAITGKVIVGPLASHGLHGDTYRTSQTRPSPYPRQPHWSSSPQASSLAPGPNILEYLHWICVSRKQIQEVSHSPLQKRTSKWGFPALTYKQRKGKALSWKIWNADSHKLSVNSALSRADRGQIAGGRGDPLLRHYYRSSRELKRAQ